MYAFQVYILKVCRKIYQLIFKISNPDSKRDVILNPNTASDIIYNTLLSPNPCMIARFGSTETDLVVNYLSIYESSHSIKKYFHGEIYDWWWNKEGINRMREWSGFFPLDEKYLIEFAKLMASDTQQLDVLGSWLNKEFILLKGLNHIKRVQLLFLEPYWADKPWTRVLRGKKVLVIHPFARLIEKQYNENRTHLFCNPDVLPEFDLQTIKAVQSLGGYGGQFTTWFDALKYMEDEIDKRDYDIALIGCGAYGFPLAAHVKRRGKKAVHMGGALQLLFGIKGKRWETQDYGKDELGKKGMYPQLFNEYWCRPGDDVKPSTADNVEGACYW